MMASAPSATWSLVKTLETWLRMVFGLRWRRLATSGWFGAARRGRDFPPLCQLREGVDGRGPGCGEVVDQSFRDDGSEDRLAGGDGSDRAEDLRFQRSLEQVPTDAGLKRGEEDFGPLTPLPRQAGGWVVR